MSKVTCITPCANMLGEGPFWDGEAGRLYWFDIRAPKLLSYAPGSGDFAEWTLPRRSSAGAPTSDGRLIIACESGIALFDPLRGAFDLVSPFAPPAGFRSNDGKIDLAGRLWWSLMDDHGGKRPGFVRRFDGADVEMLSGVHIPNGLASSPDGRTRYVADSKKGVIWAFDLEGGALGEHRVFAQTEPGASPDGMAIDANGGVWNAHWGAWRVVRYRPDGTIDRTISLPVEQPTSCAFGGPDLRTLYITSARDGLSERALADQPLAGGLFAARVETPGLSLPPFPAGNLSPP